MALLNSFFVRFREPSLSMGSKAFCMDHHVLPLLRLQELVGVRLREGDGVLDEDAHDQVQKAVRGQAEEEEGEPS